MEPKSKQWSAYQLAIFREIAEGRGHLAVDAKAGSGKTTTILEGLKYIPAGKSALFVAFNKAIAEELKARVARDGIRGVEVSTLHSYGLRAVTKVHGRLRIESRRCDGLARDLVGDARDLFDLRVSLCKTVSLAKGCLASTREEVDAIVDGYEIDTCPELTRKASGSRTGNEDRYQFISYVLALLERCKDVSDGEIDFDDMIWLPVVQNLPVWKHDRVFVDETQDLNACQIKLVLGAVKEDGRVCAVGDPHQAIYRFRGADENAFGRVVECLDAKVMPLSVTYRCARSIVAVAQQIVPELEAAPGAIDGVVRDAWLDECRRDAAPGDFILSRTNAPLIGLCLGFLREGRKANIAGRDIGATLAAFVKKSGAANVEALRRYVDTWRDAECKRLAEKQRDTQAVDDKADCLLALSDGAASVPEVVARIEALFSDGDNGARITLSTTHKAKGLERDRVWMLAATYRRRPGVEEDNLYYVAATRAKRELVMVYERKV